MHPEENRTNPEPPERRPEIPGPEAVRIPSTGVEDPAPESPNAEPAAGQAFRVSRSEDGMRLDACLTGRLDGRSRVYVQRCIRANHVRLNGKPSRPSERVKVNDLIEFSPPPEPEQTLAPEDIPFDILYEDDSVIVLNKPPGLVVHPARGHWTGTLVHGLLGHDEASFSSMAAGGVRPGIVHRLDRDTSGVMVVARNERARLALSRAFAERRVEKTYLALVIGEFGSVTGRIEAPIGRHPWDRLKMAVTPSGGKRAVSCWRVLASNGEVSLVEVRIETGRTHQIRVHFAHIYHPVLGDPVYGGQRRDLSIACDRQMLHAWKLLFPHPVTGVMREYRAPPPEDFQQALDKAGFDRIGASHFD